MKSVFMLAAACLLLTGFIPGASAMVTGKIEGTVVDGNGAPVGGITLVLKPSGDRGSGVARKFKVNKKGMFKQPFTPTGLYQISSGDEAWFVKHMKLEVLDPTNLVLNAAEMDAHPVHGLPPITITSGLKIVLELTVVDSKEKKVLTQQFDLQESSGELKNILKLVEQGAYDEAVAGLEDILADKPDLGAAQYLKGQTLFRLERYEEANECFRRTLVLDPGQPDVHGNLALSLLRQGEALETAGDKDAAAPIYLESVAEFELAAAEDPENIAILTSRVAAMERAGSEGVPDALRGILALKPDHLQVRLRLADLLTRSGDGAEALKVLDAMDTDDPAVASTLFNVAVKFYNDDQLETAVLAVERAIQADPGLAAGYRLLGRAKMSLGETEAAIAALTKFLELAPDDPSAETEKRLIEALKAG
jgi:tetratricopeptide (TPR) repeat protein